MSRKKKTVQDYHNLAKSSGFEWVGDVLPQNTHASTKWKCLKGHEWESCYHSIQKGTGCPYCSGKVPKAERDYRNLAKVRGLEWVSSVLPSNTNTPTKWKCPEGHEWKTCYSSIQRGSGCPECAVCSRIGQTFPEKEDKDYRDLAKECGFQWIGGVLPRNTRIPTKWKCQEGHEWEARYNNIQNGTGCPFCAGKAPKTDKNYRDLAKEHGFEWMDNMLPPNTNTPTKWKCQEGHEWDACYNDIQRGSGCHYCAGCVPKTDNDYHDLANERGFQWVGSVLPPNVSTPTKWKCSKGHEWDARYHDIQDGTGCPECWEERRCGKKVPANDVNTS